MWLEWWGLCDGRVVVVCRGKGSVVGAVVVVVGVVILLWVLGEVVVETVKNLQLA